MKNKAFTLIELIVVMAIIAILVLLAAPRFLGYTKEARETKLVNDIRVVENQVEEYLIKDDDSFNQMRNISQQSLNNIGKGGSLYSVEGITKKVEPGDYKIFESKKDGNFYVNERGKAYRDISNEIIVLDEEIELTKNKSDSQSEFVATYDLAPIFETYGDGFKYTLSFEIKSKNIDKKDDILVYMQSHSGSMHSFVHRYIPVNTEEYEKVVISNLKPKLTNTIDVRTGKKYTTSHLSFYGDYGTSNIPVVRNIKLVVQPSD